jgi:hypothetical protein
VESELLVDEVLAGRLPTTPSARARWIGSLFATPLSLALLLALAWLLVAPNSPDLAAQAYRARLFGETGFIIWDDNWYAGHHLLGYSLLYPWMAWLFGVRLVGAIAVLISTWAFERIVLDEYGAAARWGALCFALAASGDLWIGRLTFALGVAFAMLAVSALRARRRWLAGSMAALCAASSPVAGLLLALAGATRALDRRRPAPAVALAVPALAVVLALQALFPEGGWEPFTVTSVLATLAVTGAFVCALPREERLLRLGGALYAPVTLLSLLHTPMGSNVQRYGALLAAPLLLCGLARSGWRGRRRPRWWVAGSLCAILAWTAWGPVRQTAQALRDPSTDESFYASLRSFLAREVHRPVRIEVPFTKSHWDAALLAPYVALARGWERQLDKRYNAAIEADPLAPATYRRWLQRNAVSYVALPDARLDDSSMGEGLLVAHGVPYLREVLHTRHWRIFAVLDPTPLASRPATVLRLGHDSFELRFARTGSSLVRVRYTPYWALIGGSGCVGEGPEGWTAVSVPHAGVVRVAARFSLSRALGLDGGCS